jgi:hypothetical protein
LVKSGKVFIGLIEFVPLEVAGRPVSQFSRFGAGQSAEQTVYVLEIDGGINPPAADYIDRVLGDAARENTALAVIRLDTPGGLDTSMRKIVQGILNSPVPVRDIQEAMSRQMSAERLRRATVTEADGRRDAAVKVAEGDRQARILQAEGEKQATILGAQGKREAYIEEAEG